MMGRRCYVLLRRRYDVPIRRCRDAPLRRLGDVPLRPRWVFHWRRTCDVTGTYRETSLRRRHDVLMPGGNIFWGVAESVAAAAAVNPNGIKTLLDGGLSSFFIQGNPAFSKGPKSLPKILQITLFYATEFLIILC